MPLTVIRSVPDAAKYTPLSTHQSATPASFTIPVLHFRSACTIVLATAQASLLPIFGEHKDSTGPEVVVSEIDVWVTSENLILYNPALGVGVELPYTSVTLHAIQHIQQGKGIYMQLALSPAAAQTSNNECFDDDDMIELTALPSGVEEDAQVEAFFKALSDCANLNPDPDTSGSDDEDTDGQIMLEGSSGGATLAGFPGEGGWITAENVDQFQFEDVEGEDAEGGIQILGPGAGTVRLRDEDEVEETSADVVEETKWRRTE